MTSPCPKPDGTGLHGEKDQPSGLLDGQDDREAHGMFQNLSDALLDRYGTLPEVDGQ